MDKDINIRLATPEDAEGILEVYEPYVTGTAISFETEVPIVDEMRGRIERTLQNYPYYIALKNNKIIGYCYTGPFVGRQAYMHSAETTIYLSDEAKGIGLGRRFYELLEDISIKQNITNLYACIGYPSESNDEYLDDNSERFHAHMGFDLVGRFHKCGYKFGRWYDMVWMEKVLQETTEDFIPFKDLNL